MYELQPSTVGSHVYRIEVEGDAGRVTQNVPVQVVAAAPTINALSASPTLLPWEPARR